VAIGGQQTGVYPNNSAGGWNIIGKTPIDFFDVENVNPCFAKAGDSIKFKSIALDEFYQLEKEIKENNYQLLKTSQDA
jgi:inhibitor of KinA